MSTLWNSVAAVLKKVGFGSGEPSHPDPAQSQPVVTMRSGGHFPQARPPPFSSRDSTTTTDEASVPLDPPRNQSLHFSPISPLEWSRVTSPGFSTRVVRTFEDSSTSLRERNSKNNGPTAFDLSIHTDLGLGRVPYGSKWRRNKSRVHSNLSSSLHPSNPRPRYSPRSIRQGYDLETGSVFCKIRPLEEVSFLARSTFDSSNDKGVGLGGTPGGSVTNKFSRLWSSANNPIYDPSKTPPSTTVLEVLANRKRTRNLDSSLESSPKKSPILELNYQHGEASVPHSSKRVKFISPPESSRRPLSTVPITNFHIPPADENMTSESILEQMNQTEKRFLPDDDSPPPRSRSSIKKQRVGSLSPRTSTPNIQYRKRRVAVLEELEQQESSKTRRLCDCTECYEEAAGNNHKKSPTPISPIKAESREISSIKAGNRHLNLTPERKGFSLTEASPRVKKDIIIGSPSPMVVRSPNRNRLPSGIIDREKYEADRKKKAERLRTLLDLSITDYPDTVCTLDEPDTGPQAQVQTASSNTSECNLNSSLKTTTITLPEFGLTKPPLSHAQIQVTSTILTQFPNTIKPLVEPQSVNSDREGEPKQDLVLVPPVDSSSKTDDRDVKIDLGSNPIASTAPSTQAQVLFPQIPNNPPQTQSPPNLLSSSTSQTQYPSSALFQFGGTDSQRAQATHQSSSTPLQVGAGSQNPQVSPNFDFGSRPSPQLNTSPFSFGAASNNPSSTQDKIQNQINPSTTLTRSPNTMKPIVEPSNGNWKPEGQPKQDLVLPVPSSPKTDDRDVKIDLGSNPIAFTAPSIQPQVLFPEISNPPQTQSTTITNVFSSSTSQAQYPNSSPFQFAGTNSRSAQAAPFHFGSSNPQTNQSTSVRAPFQFGTPNTSSPENPQRLSFNLGPPTLQSPGTGGLQFGGTTLRSSSTPFQFGSQPSQQHNPSPFSFGASGNNPNSTLTQFPNTMKPLVEPLNGNSKPERESKQDLFPSLASSSKPDNTIVKIDLGSNPNPFTAPNIPPQVLFPQISNAPQTLSPPSVFPSSTSQTQYPSSAPFQFGGTNNQSAQASTFHFGSSNTQTNQSTTVPVPYQFVTTSTPQNSQASCFNFGTPTPQPPGASAFQFGGANPQSTSTPFQFGAGSQNPQVSSNFQFGSQPSSQQNPSPFSFGAAGNNANSAQGGFQFAPGSVMGQQQPQNTMFTLGGTTGSSGRRTTRARRHR